jgi:hypothetical protein
MYSPQVEQVLEEILCLESQVLLLKHRLGTDGDDDAEMTNWCN